MEQYQRLSLTNIENPYWWVIQERLRSLTGGVVGKIMDDAMDKIMREAPEGFEHSKFEKEMQKQRIEDARLGMGNVMVNPGDRAAIQTSWQLDITHGFDPNGTPQHTAGAKLDAGKERPYLMEAMTNAIAEMEKAGTFGANKYTAYGWYKVPDAKQRYLDAFKRHWNKYNRGEDYDDESQAHHIGCCMWNLAAYLELTLNKPNRALTEAYGEDYLTKDE